MTTETGTPRPAGATAAPLRPLGTPAWRRGFAPLMRKELGQWWRTRQWMVQLLTWVVLVNGVVGLAMLTDPSDDPLTMFLQFGMTVTAIGVVVTTQGAIVGEQQRGTAAWVLSKPVTRSSFLVSKLSSYAVGFTVLAVAVPAVGYVLESRAIIGTPPDAWPLLGALALWALHVLVYLALVLAMGTLFHARGPVAAVGMGTVLAGLFFAGMVPIPVVTVLPWSLPELAVAVAQGGDTAVSLPVAVGANAAVVVAATLVGSWRLARLEL